MDLVSSLEWCILSSLNHAQAITSNNPFLPILLQLPLSFNNFSFAEFTGSHMWMEVTISLESRNRIRNDLIDLLQLISFGLWDKEDSSMWEAIHRLKSDLKWCKILQSFLENPIGILELRSINERKAEVDMRLPSLERRIKLLPNSLYLLIIHLNRKSQSSMINQFDVIWDFECFHDIFIDILRRSILLYILMI